MDTLECKLDNILALPPTFHKKDRKSYEFTILPVCLCPPSVNMNQLVDVYEIQYGVNTIEDELLRYCPQITS
jgi:hypothetical protein